MKVINNSRQKKLSKDENETKSWFKTCLKSKTTILLKQILPLNVKDFFISSIVATFSLYTYTLKSSFFILDTGTSVLSIIL